MTLTPPGPYPPNAELVAQAWIVARVSELNADVVGMALPTKVEKWKDSGFLRINALPVNAPEVDLPVRHSVVTLDGWGCTMSGENESRIKPAWNLAARPLELVRLATEDAQTGHYGETIEMLVPNYRQARVQAVYLITEPVRVPDDPSGYGRFTADLAIDWVPA